jgi:hypothetical protein
MHLEKMNYCLNFSQMMGLCLQKMMKELDEYLVMMRPQAHGGPSGRGRPFLGVCMQFMTAYMLWAIVGGLVRPSVRHE